MGLIVGVDEVGRGCWAGPLVAAAVLLREPVAGLADSKLLSRINREILSAHVYERAYVGLGWVDAAFIDKHGLTAATRQAMADAVNQIDAGYTEIIIDGNFNYLDDNPMARAVIKADGSVPVVSAASIVAKVARDRYMTEQAMIYPDYQFDKHVGYGTKTHMELLRLHGACGLHRLSYRPLRGLVVNDV